MATKVLEGELDSTRLDSTSPPLADSLGVSLQFIIHLSPPAQSSSSAVPVQIAYLDPRRLGRIRLVQSPSTEPPVSLVSFLFDPPLSRSEADACSICRPQLGPDPILCPPTIAQLSLSLLRRKSPIKSVLLDQSVAAGVGNWVAGESRLPSPAHRLPSLTKLLRVLQTKSSTNPPSTPSRSPPLSPSLRSLCCETR